MELTYAGQEVEITEASTTLHDDRQKIKISLNKVLEQDERFQIGMNGEITTVQFGLYATEDITADDDSVIPADGLIETINCAEDGSVVFVTDLPLGSYYVKEISTDKHYTLPDTVYPVLFEYAGPDVALVEVALNDGKPITNELVYGSIKGLKIDRENQETIAGALFGLFRPDALQFTSDTAILTSTSDEDLGIVTQNRTGSRSYKDKTMIQKPETEWICHEDAHEAIVDRKLWETVQEKNRAVKQQAANRAAPLPALFTGKLVCADCGHPLVATRETQRRKNGTSKRYVSYICSHFVTTGRSACSWHRIYEISLKTLVLNEIRAHSRAVAQDENAVLDKLRQQILSESAARQEDSRLEISRLRRRIGELEHMTAKLYEDKVSGIINNDTFAVLIQKSEQERLQKAERLEVLLAEEQKARQEVENIRQWAGIIRRYLDVQELDREIVEELIDHIEIGERSVIDGQRQQDIKIFYRFVGVV